MATIPRLFQALRRINEYKHKIITLTHDTSITVVFNKNRISHLQEEYRGRITWWDFRAKTASFKGVVRPLDVHATNALTLWAGIILKNITLGRYKISVHHT